MRVSDFHARIGNDLNQALKIVLRCEGHACTIQNFQRARFFASFGNPRLECLSQRQEPRLKAFALRNLETGGREAVLCDLSFSRAIPFAAIQCTLASACRTRNST